MAGPPELAEIFITAAFRSIHSPRGRHQIRQARLGFPTPAHTPEQGGQAARGKREQGGQAARGKRPAASHAPPRLT